MASFNYHALPVFGEECRDKYGFSDACIIGNRLIVTGHKLPNVEDQIAQAFNNVNDLIIHSLIQEGHAIEEGRTGWDYVVKLCAFFVGLSGMRVKARENMVHNIKNWCHLHQPLFTVVGIESLPFPEHLVEFEVDVWIP
ncbi:hypothetical protein IFM51744_02375 [Aspergillus udagawae]|nr:hypothetical protein IFM51744_02375 [Aspergillus udagawae]GFG17669.1 hypothetical protein IFM5058_08598 [Aspergillus udagawae]